MSPASLSRVFAATILFRHPVRRLRSAPSKKWAASSPASSTSFVPSARSSTRASWTRSAKADPRLHIFQESTVRSSSVTPAPETYYPAEVAASTLHQGGVTGRGVTVAVLDTSVWRNKGPLQATSYGRSPRVLAQYDVILDRENPAFYATRLFNKYGADIDDLHGHGTHVSSVIASSAVAQTGRYQGVAPGVNLVSVRVLDSEGRGRYFDVIRGIQWVVNNRYTYGIRVINLSLSGTPTSHYWEDPLNQAVMAAWNAGIVVVAAAGNSGPTPMTIGVPGNVPYVVTVGAVTDNYQPLQPQKYTLASFSAAGPTYEGFVKPEVVSMGGHLRAYAPDDGTLALEFPNWVDSTYRDLTISGTSQAAAVTSGVVALMLEANPSSAARRRQMSSDVDRSPGREAEWRRWPTRCSSRAPVS